MKIYRVVDAEGNVPRQSSYDGRKLRIYESAGTAKGVATTLNNSRYPKERERFPYRVQEADVEWRDLRGNP